MMLLMGKYDITCVDASATSIRRARSNAMADKIDEFITLYDMLDILITDSLRDLLKFLTLLSN